MEPTRVTIAELAASTGRVLGPGPWRAVDQERINLFADATEDHQWIHVDPERAAEGPFGRTIAHGYLSLSMIPTLFEEMLDITDRRMGVNYGIDKLRFTAPVPSGSRVRLKATVGRTRPKGTGVQFNVNVEMQIEGQDRPAFVGDIVLLAYP
ncbi:MAG: hypothetical protein GEU74_07765 [Nitriliruptorales bacterium]|nr:hypothetical protein [Nitriliruptorales bacterium]